MALPSLISHVTSTVQTEPYSNPIAPPEQDLASSVQSRSVCNVIKQIVDTKFLDLVARLLPAHQHIWQKLEVWEHKG